MVILKILRIKIDLILVQCDEGHSVCTPVHNGFVAVPLNLQAATLPEQIVYNFGLKVQCKEDVIDGVSQ
jgi:hypothetical protein